MLEEYKTKTNIGVGIGLLLTIAGRFVQIKGGEEGLGLIMVLVGVVLFTWGCCMYAQAKGYSPAVGLLGLLSIIGLIILVCLSDKAQEPPRSRSYGYGPPPFPPRR